MRYREIAEARPYPMAPRGEWYGNVNFADHGGRIVTMSPDQFLAKVRPLDIDDASRDNIDDLKAHIESGRTLDPLVIYPDGKEDGRHRAHAAKELGIDKVPVILFKALDEDAFHGSPHDFEKFDIGKIGTGEGNQVYGWGLYFTDLEDIAHHYRKTLTTSGFDDDDDYDSPPSVSCWLDGKTFINGKQPMNTMSPLEIACITLWHERMNSANAIIDLDRDIKQFSQPLAGASEETQRERLAFADNLAKAKHILQTEKFWGRLSASRGNVYHVELPDSHDWLLWDAPATQQPDAVQDAIQTERINAKVTGEWRSRGFGKEYGYRFGAGQYDFIGMGKYQTIDTAHPEDGIAVLWRVHKNGGWQNLGTVKTEDEARTMIEAKVQIPDAWRTGGQLYRALSDKLGSDKKASLWLREHGVPGVKYLNGQSRQVKGEENYNYVVFDDSHVKVKRKQQY